MDNKYRGYYKAVDASGNLITYNPGDVVSKNGINYLATATITGYSPEHGTRVGWVSFGDGSGGGTGGGGTGGVTSFAGFSGDVAAAVTSNQIVYHSGTAIAGSDNFTFDGTDVVLGGAGHFEGAFDGSLIKDIKADEVLSAGDPVYITGNVGNSNRVTVARADASNVAKMPAAGVVAVDFANNAQGTMTIVGVIKGFDTDTPPWVANQELYVASGGGLTGSRPTAGTVLVQKIARVGRLQANTGTLIVHGAGRANDTPNLIVANAGISMNAGGVTFADGTFQSTAGGTGAVWDRGGETFASTLGGVAAGTSFADGTSAIAILETLLYPYQPVSFSAFDIGLSSGPYEVGQTGGSSTVNSTWTTSGPNANWVAGSLSISANQSVGILVSSLDYDDSPIGITHSAYNFTTRQTLTFTIAGQQDQGSDPTKTDTMNWRYRYFSGRTGEGFNGTGLTGQGFANILTRTSPDGWEVTFAAASAPEDYGYFVIPSVENTGTLSFTNTANNLGWPFTRTVTNYSHTNAYGHSVNYDIYESDNGFAGEITIRVNT